MLGYNTNGFAFHSLLDAIDVLAEIGYRSVALTLDHHHLNPFADDFEARLGEVRERLDARGMARTIETGARFLLDPRRKHQPTLISRNPADRARRVDFLRRAIVVARQLDAQAVSLWSGAPDEDAAGALLMDRLAAALNHVLPEAERCGLRVAFEPEPGMFIDRMETYAELAERLRHPLLGLTLDVGHIHCLEDGSLAGRLGRWKDVLWNVHLEDMRRGRHEHLFFGEGEIDFAGVRGDLDNAGYRGPVHVELSAHSADAVSIARRAYEFLRGVGFA